MDVWTSILLTDILFHAKKCGDALRFFLSGLEMRENFEFKQLRMTYLGISDVPTRFKFFHESITINWVHVLLATVEVGAICFYPMLFKDEQSFVWLFRFCDVITMYGLPVGYMG